MIDCPHCGEKLNSDELDSVMDKLSINKINGEHEFNPSCCGKDILAYSEFGIYYIKIENQKPQMIGAN